MPRKRHDELTAGIFILAALVAILGVVLWLGGSDLFKPTRQTAYFYVTEESSPGGLAVGSVVQLGGAPIGKIAQFEVDAKAGKVYYVAKIENSQVKIHSDARARSQAGLIGGAVLAVTQGSSGKGLADKDHAILIAGGLDQAMNDLAAAAESIRKELDATQQGTTLAQVKQVLQTLLSASETVGKTVSNVCRETAAGEQGFLMAKIHTITDGLADMLAAVSPKVKQTASDVADTAGRIKQYTEKDVAELLATLRQTNTEILKVAKDFSGISGEVKQTVMVNRESIDEMIDSMAIVAANLKAASKEIRRNPWRLLYKPTPEESKQQNLYDAARAFLAGAEELDQALGKLNGLAKGHPDGVPADDPKLQEIRKQVLDTFEQFKKAEDALWKEMK